MRERETSENSPEALLEMAQQEFGVDLRNSQELFRKAIGLSHAANRSMKREDFDRIYRLNDLFEEYSKVSGNEEAQRQAA